MGIGAGRVSVGTGIAIVACTMLAACGGGGGVQSTPTPPSSLPTPTPRPTPTPTPTPTPAVNYDTPGYRATAGAVAMNALAAYQRGATGAGVALAILDSGIDSTNPRFAGRIAASSTDLIAARGIGDSDGHGTAVAFTAAGGREGTMPQGVAFDATLVVLRADQPGSCGAAGSNGTSCAYPSDAIVRGLDAARVAGARVVNISLGARDVPADVSAAVGRATAAGLIVVIAAGNDGESDPTALAQIANNNAVARGQVIVAGSIGQSGVISSFSNRAGLSAAHYLTALGERIDAPDASGTRMLWSGTSFAAPQITGAAALLAQAFPNLTGAQIVELLLRTARDAGAAGTDTVYGRGTLDLTAAFQPIGGMQVAGQTASASATVGLSVNARLSAAMGDARASGLNLVALDQYRRAFAVDLSSTIASSGPRTLLAPALLGQFDGTTVSDGTRTVTLTSRTAMPGETRLRAISPADANGAPARRIVAGTIVQQLTPQIAAGFAFASGGDALVAGWTGQAGPGFLLADHGLGLDQAPRAAAALRRAMDGTGVTLSLESGRFAAPFGAERTGLYPVAPRYDQMDIRVDRSVGDVALLLGVTRLVERRTVLGGWFGGALGQPHATSWFAQAMARWQDAGGWTLAGQWRQGWTRATGAMGGGALNSRAWAIEAGKRGLFGGDRIDLRLSQPLRVTGGGLDLRLPVHWDYASEQVDGWSTERLALRPSGHEMRVELRHAVALGPGQFSTHLFWRRDPGHVATLPAERGLAMKYGLAF